MVHQVLRHEATLRQDNRLGARIARRDGHDGGLAQGVNLLELRGREESFFVAVEDLDFVGDFEFFEEPDDALRAGVIEPGGGELAICCEYASRGGGRCDTALSRLLFPHSFPNHLPPICASTFVHKGTPGEGKLDLPVQRDLG